MHTSSHKIIVLNNLVKRFNLGHKIVAGFLPRVLQFLSGKESKKTFEVLRDVSFEIQKGEVVGVIGKNGSGKSTLLRLLAGIYKEDSGFIRIYGKSMYINGFNHGIRPRLTMRENIFLVGAIMGLTKIDVQRVFGQIIEFSGLEEYVDTKVYQFSSGMIARLQFSLFVHFVHIKKPDILLIDEVLVAGGDIDFSKKSSEEIKKLINTGMTVLLVSHHLKDIEDYCSRVIWIEKGMVKENGNVIDILEKYRSSK